MSNTTTPTETAIVRTIVSAEEIQKMASRRTDYNSDRNTDNFRHLEFKDVVFSNENFNGSEFNFSKLENVTFQMCQLENVEMRLAEMNNVRFENCSVRNMELHMTQMQNVVFDHCLGRGIEMQMAQGDVTFNECDMPYLEANMAHLAITAVKCNANGFDGNAGDFKLTFTENNLRNCEFNDAVVSGKIEGCDCTNSEFDRADMRELVITDCATSGMSADDAVGFENHDSEDDIMNELFDDDDDN